MSMMHLLICVFVPGECPFFVNVLAFCFAILNFVLKFEIVLRFLILRVLSCVYVVRYVVRYVISYHEVSYHDVSDNGILFQNFLENCRENIAKASRKSLENHYEIAEKSTKIFLMNIMKLFWHFLKNFKNKNRLPQRCRQTIFAVLEQ